MSANNIPAGDAAPDLINVIIEISMLSQPVKYEVNKDFGCLQVDRFLSSAMHYPCNYGYVPQTLCDDGDPIDVLVVAPLPIQPGALIVCQPLGMLEMEDEKGIDHKILAIPAPNLVPSYRDINKLEDISSSLLDSISHFFEHYKDLEKNKWTKIKGWLDEAATKKAITESIASYKAPVTS